MKQKFFSITNYYISKLKEIDLSRKNFYVKEFSESSNIELLIYPYSFYHKFLNIIITNYQLVLCKLQEDIVKLFMINDTYMVGKPDNIHFTSLGGGIPKNWLDFPKQFNFWLISVFFGEKKQQIFSFMPETGV